MRLNLRRTSFPPPTPEERRQAIAAMKWGLFDAYGYTPHSAQMDVHLSNARFRTVIAGTRGGKSRCTGEEVVPYLFAGATRCWIVAQNYALGEKEYRYTYDRMTSQMTKDMFGGTTPIENAFLEKAVYNESQGNMYLRTKWGSELKVISLERPGGAFGEEVDLIVVAEPAVIKRPKILWERILRGRLASRLGDLILDGTPGGSTSKNDPDGWMMEYYEKGLNPDYDDYFTREWPSWENPFFLEDPYELRAELDAKIFAEQYEGKFVSFSGSVYDFVENVHVIPPFPIPKHWYRYEAIDPGYSGEFAWVSSVSSESGALYITGEYTDSERLYADRVREIKNKRCEQYRIPHGMWDTLARKENIRTTLYIDPEDPQCRAEFMKLGLPGLPANNNINVGIDRVQRRLKCEHYPPTLYVTTDCPRTIDALKNHSWGEKVIAGDVIDLRKPANDKWKHLADATRYICAGGVVPSESRQEKPATQETLWDILNEELLSTRDKHVHDRTAYERRRGGIAA